MESVSEVFITNKSDNSMPRLFQLDGLRFFLCMIIVCSHFEFLESSDIGSIYTTYLSRGSLAVDFFFILSGFGIYYASHSVEQPISWKSSILYSVHKIRKIYPIYLISLLMGALGTLPTTFSNHGALGSIVRISAYTVADLFMVQSFSGNSAISCSFNGVCWFLSTLYICYMFCPLFIRILNKTKCTLGGFFLTVSITLGLSFLAEKADGVLFGGIIDNIRYGHPFIRCLYLLIGMYSASFFLKFRSRFINTSMLETAALVIYFFYFIFQGVLSTLFSATMLRLLDILTTVLLIVSLSFGKGFITKLLSHNTLVSLGNDAMYVFLLHYPIRIALELIAQRIQLVDICGSWSYFIQIFLVFFLTAICISVLKRFKPQLDELFAPLFLFIDRLLL